MDDFAHDGAVSEWRARPVDRILPPSRGRPQALTWVGQVPDGLVVAAEIRATRPGDAEAVLEISLSAAEPPDLPPIGWGHQFGIEVAADSTACGASDFASEDVEGCRAWYRRQQELRVALPALFERVWHVRPAEARMPIEVRAGRAFGELDEPSRIGLAPLEPRGDLSARSRLIAGTEGGRGVEILIPWSAFPPVPAPDLDELRLSVRWAGADGPGGEASAGPDAVSAPERRPLARPLRHIITPCRYGLSGILVPGGDDEFPREASGDAVAYMIPEVSGDLRSLIVLDHPVAGYQYDPAPDARSPSAFEVRYDVLDVGRGQRICTPILALASEGRRLTPPGWTHGAAARPETADLRHLDVRRLDDGDLLVLQRPHVLYSYYGSGQCGACPRIVVTIDHVSVATGEVTPLLRLVEIAEPDSRDLEIEIADDWSRVIVYRSLTDWSASPPIVSWTATILCPEGGDRAAQPYAQCGELSGVPEPPVRLRGRYRQPG